MNQSSLSLLSLAVLLLSGIPWLVSASFSHRRNPSTDGLIYHAVAKLPSSGVSMQSAREYSGEIMISAGLPNPELDIVVTPGSTIMFHLMEQVQRGNQSSRVTVELHWTLDFSLFPNVRQGEAPVSISESGVFVTVRATRNGRHAATTLQVLEIRVRPRGHTFKSQVYIEQTTVKTMQTAYVLMDWSDGVNVCNGRAALETLLFTGSRNLDGYFRTMSNGRYLTGKGDPNDSTNPAMTYRVFGPYTFNEFKKSDDCRATFDSWFVSAKRKLAALGTAVYNENEFGNLILVTPKPTSCGFAGRASVSKSCFPRSTLGPRCKGAMLRCAEWVFTHELGHNMGMSHSATDYGDDGVTDSEYGDWSCVMGNAPNWNRLNSYHMYDNGFLKADRVLITDSPGNFTLSSLDDDTSIAPHPQIVAFYDKSSWPTKMYFLSLRIAVGYTAQMSALYRNNIDVHYKKSDSQFSHFIKHLGSSSHTSTNLGWVMSQTSVDLTTNIATLTINPCASASTCGYAWSSGTWSDCANVCGSRTVTCQRTSDSTVMGDGWCVLDGAKPATVKSCTGLCQFTWFTGAWSTTCSLKCGGGSFSRAVECHDIKDQRVADQNCQSIGTKPASSKPCNTAACPQYQWSMSDWSTCSKDCGGGTRMRTVQCMTSVNGLGVLPVVDDSNCASAGNKPVSQESCNARSCNPCSTRDCGGGDQGLCVVSAYTATCMCHNGYTGNDCEFAPTISGVRVDRQRDVTNGFTVYWEISANVTVSILLQRHGVPFSTVISSGVAGVARSFTFGNSFFPRSGNFTVTVQFSSTVNGVSALFFVNACDHHNCVRGSCGALGSCQCTGGYTGELCNVPPPDPCAGVVCERGSCNSTLGRCDCPQGATGWFCEGTAVCQLSCRNFGRVIDGCTRCNCSTAPQYRQHPWGGTLCDVCARDDCGKHGSPEMRDCATCVCDAGYIGGVCDRREFVVRIGPFQIGMDAVQLDRVMFDSSFINDLASALQIDASRIQIVEVSTGVFIKFSLLSLPLSQYTLSSVSSVSSSPAEFRQFEHIVHTQAQSYSSFEDAALANLLVLVENLKGQMIDPSSALYRGGVTSLMMLSAASIQVSDPGTLTPPTQPPLISDSSSSNGVAIGLGVTFALLFVAVGGFFAYRYHRDGYLSMPDMDCLHFSREKNPFDDPVSHDVVMGTLGRPNLVAPQAQQQKPQCVVSNATATPATTDTMEGQNRLGGGQTTTEPGAPPPLPPRQTLPTGWEKYFTDEGVPYYYCESTGESRWDVPK